MNKIILVTGEKAAGKTTTLMREFGELKTAGGVLMPVKEGLRYFYSFESGTYWNAEAEETATEILEVGRFRFSARAFEKANDIVIQNVSQLSTIIIDEIGPLEMVDKKGFYKALLFCLEHIESIEQLVLVVRPALQEDLKQLCFEYCDDVSIRIIDER